MPALPEGSLLLHIGPPKTGSTAIQMALHESRAVLAQHGVLYPGTRMRDRPASYAVLGTRPALGREFTPQMTRWYALVDEIRRTSLRRACLSHENFARADDEAVARILDSLGAERTHVVYVARRLDKVLPSHWQERVKARHTESYGDFLRRVLDEPPDRRPTWQPQDVSSVIGRWAARVGQDQVTIIVSDEHDHAFIPRTFESLLDVPVGTLVPPTSRSNVSLSYTEAEGIRRINQLARDEGWAAREYWKVVQDGVVRALRDRDRTEDLRIEGLPEWAFAGVVERADRQIDEIAKAGVRVVGDPERLRVSTHAQPVDLPDVVESVPLDVLARMVQGTVEGTRSMRVPERTRVDAGSGPTGPRPIEHLGDRQLVRLLVGRVARRIGLR